MKRLMFFLVLAIISSVFFALFFMIVDKLYPETPVPLWIKLSVYFCLACLNSEIADKLSKK